jgi:ribosome biogenesis GTPase A
VYVCVWNQVVMVVDARNPLFYQCPDLEVKSNHAPFVGLNLKVAVELLDKDPG